MNPDRASEPCKCRSVEGRSTGAQPSLVAELSAEHVYGAPFTRLCAGEFASDLERDEERRYGVRYRAANRRPMEGAFALLQDADLVGVLRRFRTLGLGGRVAVDFFVTPTARPAKASFADFPLKSTLLLTRPREGRPYHALRFRLIVMDPMFVDEKGRCLRPPALPEAYTASALRVFFPQAMHEGMRVLFGNRLMALFGQVADGPRSAQQYAAIVQAWRERPFPVQVEVLKSCLADGIWHELAHREALSVPDVFPPEPRLARTEPACFHGKNGVEYREAFSVRTWRQLLYDETALQTTASFARNAFVGPLVRLEQERREQGAVAPPTMQGITTAGALDTGSDGGIQLGRLQDARPGVESRRLIEWETALEVFCDRYGMFMKETAAKLAIYRRALPQFGEAFPVGSMQDAEEVNDVAAWVESDEFAKPRPIPSYLHFEHLRGTNAAAFKKATGLSESATGELESAERDHFATSVVGDPPLLARERCIFSHMWTEARRRSARDPMGAEAFEPLQIERGSFARASHLQG